MILFNQIIYPWKPLKILEVFFFDFNFMCILVFKCTLMNRYVKVSQPGTRAGLKMNESNPVHFRVSQKFCNPTQPTRDW